MVSLPNSENSYVNDTCTMVRSVTMPVDTGLLICRLSISIADEQYDADVRCIHVYAPELNHRKI
jgi:hypothetical protein